MEHCEYIFIDESGDLGPEGSKFFTIVALNTDQNGSLSRIMKRLRERKLKKKMRRLPEIKASNSNDSVRRYVLERVAELNCGISAVVLSKESVDLKIFADKNWLYNHLCSLLFYEINPRADFLEITMDKRHTKRVLRDDFDRYLIEELSRRRPGIGIKIQHLDSLTSNELQVVDFIAWAVNRKLTHQDSAHYDLIKVRMRKVGNEISELRKT